MPNLDSLSQSQREIYDLLAAGKTPIQIAKKLDVAIGIVSAQMTRIRSKGITLPTPASGGADTPTDPTLVSVGQILGPPERPAATGASSNMAIANEVDAAGPALTAEQLQQLAAKVGEGNFVKDVHSQVLLGVTIQYVRLCGGRMTAHQLIEDVYGALRAFCNIPGPAGDGEAGPLPQTDREQLEFLREQNTILAKKVQDLEQKLSSRSYNPSYS